MISGIRRKGGFAIIAWMMVVSVVCISCLTREAAALMLSSRLSGTEQQQVRAQDMETLKKFLESKLVVQKLRDFGMSEKEAIEKVSRLGDEDLHMLASIVDSAPAGGDALGVAIGLAVLALIVVVILKLMNKEIIIK